MSYSNPIQDHNDRVAHSTSWHDPPENYYLEDLIHSFLVGPRTLEVRLELQDVLRKFKEFAEKYGEEEGISDDFLRDGLENLCSESVKEIWPFLKQRGDSE